MAIPDYTKVYPRTGDTQTVYLKNVVNDPAIHIGAFTIYHDFAHDPRDFQKHNVLYHYPINGDHLRIGKFCSIACGARFLFNSANYTIVGGVPAQPIRRRFPPETINELIELQWWDWPLEQIAEGIQFIQSGNIKSLRKLADCKA